MDCPTDRAFLPTTLADLLFAHDRRAGQRRAAQAGKEIFRFGRSVGCQGREFSGLRKHSFTLIVTLAFMWSKVRNGHAARFRRSSARESVHARDFRDSVPCIISSISHQLPTPMFISLVQLRGMLSLSIHTRPVHVDILVRLPLHI